MAHPQNVALDLSMSSDTVRVAGEGERRAKEPTMAMYLLSVYQPEGPMPAPEFLAQIDKNLQELNQEMRGAGVWVFSGALEAPSTATVVRSPRLQGSDAEVLTTDGPFTEAKEYLGGFTIIEAGDLDAALEWGRKLTTATTLPIEVRPFFHVTPA
jgi:hypothetical protein